jgi:hypothetical protein
VKAQKQCFHKSLYFVSPLYFNCLCAFTNLCILFPLSILTACVLSQIFALSFLSSISTACVHSQIFVILFPLRESSISTACVLSHIFIFSFPPLLQLLVGFHKSLYSVYPLCFSYLCAFTNLYTLFPFSISTATCVLSHCLNSHVFISLEHRAHPKLLGSSDFGLLMAYRVFGIIWEFKHSNNEPGFLLKTTEVL